MRLLGLVKLAAGKPDEADRAIDEAWADWWLRDALLTDRGWWHLERGEVGRAVAAFEASIRDQGPSRGADMLADAKEGLGVAAARAGDAARAKPLLAAALAVYDRQHGPTHPRAARPLTWLARVDPDRRAEYQRRLDAIEAARRANAPAGLAAAFADLK